MNVHEKPYIFENRQQKLFGILHQPEGQQKQTAVIFMHGWGTYRIGPHRLFVEAAREFAAAGFTCLRFDFRGRGESEGNVAGTTLLDMIDDAGQAVREMLKQPGISQVVFLGLCSGGEVAVGAAASDPNVDGLVLLSTPLLGRQSGAGDDVRKTANSAKGYWQKLFLPGTWAKIISLRVNYRAIFKVLFGHLQHKQNGKPMKEAGLLEAFKSYNGRCLFVYGGKDPEASSSEKAYREVTAKNGKTVFNIIPEANHNFYSVAWKQELIKQVSEWLNANFS
ncbi:MAG: hypothetical protein A2X45_06560 [Lentisphaerae bacterium GWF2_50_93]|nr:MAG: hypothetical protein A2X45_06560 [Lentisphaerae bacterium GWF2_50_93]